MLHLKMQMTVYTVLHLTITVGNQGGILNLCVSVCAQTCSIEATCNT